nr:MAG TPA: Putative vitamin uptake transporter [Caudoviricetes sp.]
MKKYRASFLQVCLTILFVSAMLISNVITSKQIQLPFGITMTGAIVIFPITYILSDVFSEVYGYKWSRVTCYFAFSMNLLMVLVFSFVIKTPAPSYWTNQEAFATVLGSTPRVMGASLLAYVIGDFVNDRVFRKMKEKHSNDLKGFGWRAIVSSFFGELCDSLVFLPIAFLGQMPLKTLATMTVCQVLIKTGYEVVILPLTTLVAKKANKYEEELQR